MESIKTNVFLYKYNTAKKIIMLQLFYFRDLLMFCDASSATAAAGFVCVRSVSC